jgi:hypothetical protein
LNSIEHHIGRIDPDSVHIPDDAWETVEVTEDFIRDRAPLERFNDGNVLYVYRTRPRELLTLLEANKRSFDDSETHKTKFGDGKVVASIPLNVLFDPKTQIAEKIKEGDRDHIRWFLNSEQAKPWRSFRGKV